ncbi:MAG TPA: transketolase C-terminal domain-containing protein [Candidatus Deferrimicrobium sp.]|nr:transketolase C-terminal domain-containing protein [Candidatus Deferrimicrobium sp.]
MTIFEGAALHDCRDAFVDALLDLVAADPRVVAVVNDSLGSTKVTKVAKAFPERVINVGIAEQDLVGIGAGLANGGKIPFVCAASPFLTARALEQIKVDAAYSAANVKLVGVSSGVAYGELGPTHHSIEDVAWTRAIDGLVVVVPADPLETSQAIRAAYELEGPIFVRTSRMPVPDVHGPDYHFRIGRAALLREGDDVTLIANGVMVSRALEAAALLAVEGIEARVLNMATASPVDREAIVAAARETRGIVTAEEHIVRGGLGGAVAEVVVAEHPVPMRLLGFPGFAPTGSIDFLLEWAGLTADGMARAAREIVSA